MVQRGSGMTGHKITLPAGTKIKDGKLTKPPARMSVSARIKQRKSKKTKVVRRTV